MTAKKNTCHRRAEDAEAKLFKVELELDEAKLFKVGFKLDPEMKMAQDQKQNSTIDICISKSNAIQIVVCCCSHLCMNNPDPISVMLCLSVTHFSRIHADKLASLYILPCVVGCIQHSIG